MELRNYNLIYKLVFIFLFSLRLKAQVELGVEFSIDAENTNTMTAAQPSVWDFRFFDKANLNAQVEIHHMFTKPVHLILIKEDFSSFSHLHPKPIGSSDHPEHSGSNYTLTINAPSSDNDDIEIQNAVPTSGNYFAWLDVMPMGGNMQVLPLDITATGPGTSTKPIVAMAPNVDGSYDKKFKDYHLKLMPVFVDHCGKVSVSFNLVIKKLNSDNKEFQDVVDLQTWLESFAHGVLISADGKTAATKSTTHYHATWPLPDDPTTERGPLIELGVHSHSQMQSGIYGLWFQFKHQDIVNTVSWVLDIQFPLANAGQKCRPMAL